MKIFKIDERYYCVTANSFSFHTFMNEIKNAIHTVEGSFAYKYSLKIFTQMFRYSDDLRQVYENYYKCEYDNFEMFLYQKELFSRETISKLYIDDGHTVLRLNPDLNSYNITNLFDYNEKILEDVNEILEALYI